MAEDRLEELSAALDGEATMPAELSVEEQRFASSAMALRAALRVSEAEAPPDVTEAVVARLRDDGRGRPVVRRHLALAAAAAFVVAAIAGALAVRPGGPAAPRPAAAELSERVIDGQRAITSLLADVRLVERGAHPEVPVRTRTGTLQYQAPERLRLELREERPVPAGWPRHDVELVLDHGSAVLDGLAGCPVSAQRRCLRPERRVVRDLPPFAPTWLSPLDLVVPTDAFLPAVPTASSVGDGTVVVETTVARIERLVDGLVSASAVRGLHATDHARLELDAGSLVLRRLTITAADNLARTTWAASNGYDDAPGAEILELELRRRPLLRPWRGADGSRATSAGFTDAPLEPAWPAPRGFTLHRTGVLQDGGPVTRVFSYSDGRAWIRIDVTDEWDEPRLLGSLGPVVRPVAVGAGTGYSDPSGGKLSLHTADRDVVVAGSVGLDSLIAAAAPVLDGEAIPETWPQARHPSELPDGALVPRGDHVAVIDGNELLIGIGGPGSTGVLLSQAPAAALGPPIKGDVVQTDVRGATGRYSPRLGTLTWLEDGWRRELHAPGLELDDLLAIARALENA